MHRRYAVLVIVLMMALGTPLASMGGDEAPLDGPSPAFARGDGSAGNPYQISNVTELQNMSANVTAHYELVADIDASATSGWNGGAGFLPVGNDTVKFSGSLDGNGHNISGLVIDRPGPDYVGLFGYLDGAEVHDLCIVDASVEGRSRVGALCGRSDSGSIANCTASGTVAGNEGVGGLAGYVTGALNDSRANVSVSGASYVGGLAGYSSGPVARCSSHGRVSTTNEYTGGLVGHIAGGTVSDSHSYGDVEGSLGKYSFCIGGFAGSIAGSVTSCSSLGPVTLSATSSTDITMAFLGGFAGQNTGRVSRSFAEGSFHAIGTSTAAVAPESIVGFMGGLVGRNQGTVSSSFSTGSCVVSASAGRSVRMTAVGGLCGSNVGILSDCYATGEVNCTATATNPVVSSCGGLVGSQASSLSNCYSAGRVTFSALGTNPSVSGVGGLLGRTTRASTACFWDNETSGTTRGVGSGTSSGVFGRTTAEMRTRATFTDEGWDFVDTWLIIENVTYPCLQAMHHPPLVAVEDGQAFPEDDPLALPVAVTVSDYPSQNGERAVSFTSDAGPWLAWNETSHALTGTPGNPDVGTHWLNVTVEDLCGISGWTNVTFTVLNVNDDPVITTPDVTSATEEVPYSVAYGAYDVDPTNDTLTWDVTTSAGWLTIDPATGLLSGTPGNDDVGDHQVTVRVTDGNGGEGRATFTLVVANVNDAPVITTVGNGTALEDLEYSQRYEAYDVDPTGDVLAWELDTDAPWLALDGDLLHGVPLNEHVGTYRVKVTVSDGHGGTASTELTLEVVNVNDPPVITPRVVEPATEDDLYYADYEAHDVDPTGDVLTWSLATDAAWLAIDPVTGTLSGRPANDDVGEHGVRITVEDGRGGSTVLELTITVVNVNDPPSIVSTPPAAVEDEPYAFSMEAEDVDAGDSLEWSLQPAGGWLSVDPDTGELSGTPSDDDVGPNLVVLTVTDGTASVTRAFTITVANTNDAPGWLLEPADVTLEHGMSLSMRVLVQDMDGDVVTYSVAADPAAEGLTIAALSGVVSWSEPRPGTYTVTVTASDGEEDVDTEFTLVVRRAPEEDEGMGTAPLWAVIAALLVVVVLLVLWTVTRGGGPTEGPGSGEDAGEREPGEDD